MLRLNTRISLVRALSVVVTAFAALAIQHAHAAAPGVTGAGGPGVFNLTAQTSYLNQPDGQTIYSWGYGCTTPNAATFAPAMTGSTCPLMQVPGPTMIVTEGQTVTITLTDNLPAAAGNTSILFPGINVASTGGVPGLLTQEAAPGNPVTYTFVAPGPGTRSYYSGTQSDLQIEMGLYGALIVLPKTVPINCTTGIHAQNVVAKGQTSEPDMRLSQAAYDHPGTCYDREYLFQFAEIDPAIHQQALTQVTALLGCTAGAAGCSLQVPTEPYRPAYFLINGRSMPDDMDPNFASQYPNQPYNGNPHMHPGEEVLLRIIGQGRWQHPFHEHANHVRILGRDGNLILSSGNVSYADGSNAPSPAASQTAPGLAGPLLFTTTTTPGLAMDGIFYFTGRGLNWDMYGHTSTPGDTDANAELPCVPDANGYNTGNPLALNYYEWCQDHNKPLQATPQGDVPGGGPATLPDPNIFTNGAWYSGSPYLGPDATARATGPNGVLQPFNVQANPVNERGYAFMWHSHNEREITTNNVFPGGMFMMMLVDSREFAIDETN